MKNRILIEERREVHTDSKRFAGGKVVVKPGENPQDYIDILPIGSKYRIVRVKRYRNSEPKWKKIEAVPLGTSDRSKEAK